MTMNITNRTTHNVQQGTGQWLRLREGYCTASEAPAALGVSRYVTRTELLRRKHTGTAEEHSPATLGKFAAGHEAEARARPLAEREVDGDLFPVTMTAEVDGLRLLASLDGLTMDDEIVWETKLWNEDLAECVRRGDLPAHYTVQMDQELLVSGAGRCLFTCTDGTPERFVSCWYEADPMKFAALVDGWKQFNSDLAAYVLPESAPSAPVGRAPDTLPALRIEVTGAVTASNLAEFKQTALAAIRGVNRDLKTDADFADAEKAVKWCADVEQRLAAAKDHALGQTATIDELFKAIDDISAEARRVRLDLDKLVTRRKAELKDQEVSRARDALALHVLAVNAEITPASLQHGADLGAAIKGLKTLDSVRAKLDAAVASEKVRLDTKAREIRENIAHCRAVGAGMEFLFSDLATLALRPADDCRALVGARIEQHKAAEARKEAERQAAEAARIAAAEQRARDEAAAAERQRQEAAARAAEQARKDEQDREDARRRALDLERRAATTPTPIPMQIVPPAAASSAEPATLKLGAICDRLGFTVTAAFLADALHIKHSATDKAAKLYRESDWPLICRQLIAHISAASEIHERAAELA